MNENENEDLAARFHLDQAEATQEQTTREATAYSLHVMDQEATIDMKRQAAALEKAKADLRNAITTVLYLVILAAVAVALVVAVQTVVGWFQ